MELVNLTKIIEDAQNKKYGVLAAEIWDSFSIKFFIDAANETRSPIILIVPVSFSLKLGIKAIVQMAKVYAEDVDIPITLHLDECQDPKIIFECIKNGFPSVMFDGAALGLDLKENIKQTKEIVKFAHYMGVTVEASLGEIPLSIEGSLEKIKGKMVKTDVNEAVRFSKETNIDILAASFGNYHGSYKHKWPNPDFILAKKLHDNTGIPLACHGSTGLNDNDISKAIASGFVKFNTGTLYQVFYKEKMKKYVNIFDGFPATFNVLLKAAEDLKDFVKNKIVKYYKSNNRY